MTAQGLDSRRQRRFLAIVFGLGVLALGLRLWAPGPTTQTYDEGLWMQRSDGFAGALANGHLSQATAIGGDDTGDLPTMPGVTTMWAGVAGKVVARGSAILGLSSQPGEPNWESPQVRRAARGVVSFATVAMLIVIVLALQRLFGRVVAISTGVVLAVEPWLVGHSALLHTDAMVTMFSAASVLALAVSLGWGGRAVSSPEATSVILSTRWFVLSAILGALAVLTKVNAAGIVLPGFIVVVVGKSISMGRSAGRDAAIRVVLLWFGIAALAGFLAWPALWVSPMEQLGGVIANPQQGFLERRKFFRGNIVTDPGILFYPVTLAFRSTVWTFLLMGTGLIGGILQIITRFVGKNKWHDGIPFGPGWLVAAVLPYLTILSFARNKYDRYALPAEPLLLAAGVIVVVGIGRRVASRSDRQVLRKVLHVAGVAALLFVLLAGSIASVAVAPYAIDYVDPLLGGQRTAAKWMPLGWGATTAELGASITSEQDGQCAGIKVAVPRVIGMVIPCGDPFVPESPAELESADYGITEVTFSQWGSERWYSEWLAANGDLVDEVIIDGVVYGELWKVRQPD